MAFDFFGEDSSKGFWVNGINLVSPDGVVKNTSIAWKEDKILFVGDTRDAPAAVCTFTQRDGNGHYFAPGLIDTHVHGARGVDFMSPSTDVYNTICSTHADGGTTSLLATTLTDTLENITSVLKFAKVYTKSENARGAKILGAHIEGPFLSPQRPGMHSVDLLRHPTLRDADLLLSAGLPVRLVTLAPELPGAADFISYIQSKNTLASGGHSDGWEDELIDPYKAGLRRVTHTFNCMSSARKRGAIREAGLLEFALSEPSIRCEAIVDGAHIPETLLRMLYRAKGDYGMTLITDATGGCGLKEGEEFEGAGTKCRIINGLALTADGKTLAGSCLTMWKAVCNMMQLTDVPLHVAIGMATWIPAKDFGWFNEVGEIKAGKRADFIIFDEALELKKTIIGGKTHLSTK